MSIHQCRLFSLVLGFMSVQSNADPEELVSINTLYIEAETEAYMKASRHADKANYKFISNYGEKNWQKYFAKAVEPTFTKHRASFSYFDSWHPRVSYITGLTGEIVGGLFGGGIDYIYHLNGILHNSPYYSDHLNRRLLFVSGTANEPVEHYAFKTKASAVPVGRGSLVKWNASFSEPHFFREQLLVEPRRDLKLALRLGKAWFIYPISAATMKRISKSGILVVRDSELAPFTPPAL